MMTTELRLMSPILCSLLILSACARPEPDGKSQSSAGADAEVVQITTGTFVSRGGQQTAGSFVVERGGDDLRLVLMEDFQTDEGPDLHIVLSPVALAEADNDNAMSGAEVVGRLMRQSGRQVYDLRDDLSLDDYRTVLVHCVEFSHLYGAATLH